jgi:cell division transport system permease protein
VRGAALHWRSELAREVTIQIRPVANRDVDAETANAVELAKNARGVVDAHALSRDETARLLEPWLGGAVDLSALPMPRLIVLRLAKDGSADLGGLRRLLAESVAGASLDDHRGWAARLAAFSDGILLAGAAVLALVLAATILSVSFATRGAVAANRATVEVLHFVGARDSFIAGAFQRHFLAIGLKGGMLGGGAAVLLFWFLGAAPGIFASPLGAEPTFVFGQLALGRQGYAGIFGIVVLVAMVTTVTSRITVRRTLRAID